MKVLFFSPFANIWEHSYPEALVSEAFEAAGTEVVTVRCGTLYQEHCVAMSAAGVPFGAPIETRQQVCRACIKRRDLLTRETGIRAIVLDDRLTDDDRIAAESIVGQATPQTWTGIELDGIPLGRIAAYELWLNLKLTSTDLAPEVWPLYLGQLRNTVLTHFGAKRVLEAEQPDAVIGYNDHYSVMRAFAATAEAAEIPSYSIHGGHHIVRRSETLTMTGFAHTMDDTYNSAAWHAYREAPIGAAEVSLVGDHFRGLLEASSAFAYSSKFEGTSPAEIRERLGLDASRPILLAAMSSEDEVLALHLIGAVPTEIDRETLFAGQFDWFEYLLDLAARRPELQVVMRLHPRMLPNKREQVTSPVVARIEELRRSAPANVVFNEPADGIGLYDLMQVVDVLLNFRSTVGAELSAMGIPAVTPSSAEFFTYPSELNRIARTTEEYEQHVDAALRDGWSLENARRAFRWYAFLFARFAVDLSDVVSSRPNPVRPRTPGLALRLYNRAVFLFLQHGPMIRERLALRRRGISSLASAVLRDVVSERRMTTAESRLWPAVSTRTEEETELLDEYFRGLLTTLWAGIDDPDSLAGRVRRHLDAAAVTE